MKFIDYISLISLPATDKLQDMDKVIAELQRLALTTGKVITLPSFDKSGLFMYTIAEAIQRQDVTVSMLTMELNPKDRQGQ